VTVQLGGTPYGRMALAPGQERLVLITNPPSGGPMQVTTLDTRTGRVVRTVIAGVNPLAVAVDPSTQHTFVINNGGGGSITMLDLRTGTVLQTLTYGNAAPQAAVVDEQAGHLFVAMGAAQHYAFRVYDTHSLRFLWSIPMTIHSAFPHPFGPTLAVDSQAHRIFVASSGSRGPGSARIQTIDSMTGTRLHTEPIGSDTAMLAVDSRAGRVLVIDRGGLTLHLLDSHTGTALHATLLSSHPTSIAVDEQAGHAFVTLDNGSVSMLETRTGQVQGLIAPGGYMAPVAVAVDARRSRAFVTGLDAMGTAGRLSVLDTRTGAILHTLALDLTPQFILVDNTSSFR